MSDRKRLRLTIPTARVFVNELNTSSNKDIWHIEDYEGENTMNARSLLGVVYAVDTWSEVYLVNDTNPNTYLDFMTKYFYFK